MANRYRVWAWWNWDNTSYWSDTDWWSTWFSVPTSSDNVYINWNASWTITLNVTVNCLDLDFTGFTWTTSAGTINCYGNLKLVSWMTFWASTITFRATSTWKTITTAWKTLWNTAFNWTWWWWALQDNYTTSWTWAAITNGAVDLNWKTFLMSWANRAIWFDWWSLTLNWGTLSVAHISSLWWWFTFNSDTWTVIFTYNATAPWSANWTLYNLTYYNLTINSSAWLRRFFLPWNVTIWWTFTVNWTSVVWRTMFYSTTSATITCNWSLSLQYCDFRSITWAWSASWDLSSITWWSWDCWWNSWITFTSSTTTTCTSWTTWSTATWSSRVPLPQDTANFSWSSRTITLDVVYLWTVDFTWSSWITFAISSSTSIDIYWDLNLTNISAISWTWTFRFFNATRTCNINCAWKTFPWAITFVGSILNINDTFSMTWAFTIQWWWTFNTNNNNITLWLFINNIWTPTINLGSSLIVITWDWTWGLLQTLSWATLNSWTSTIKLTWTLVSNITLSLNWKTFYNLWNATAWAYALTISWSNTFNDIKIDPWRTQKFTSWTTQTVNTFTAIWTWVSWIVLTSSTTSAATLAKAWWWTIQCEYCTVSYITWSPTNTWYMWTHSTNSWNNTNIYFTDAPSNSTSQFLLFF